MLLDFFQAKRLRVERLREAQAGPGVATARAAAAIDDDDDDAGGRVDQDMRGGAAATPRRPADLQALLSLHPWMPQKALEPAPLKALELFGEGAAAPPAGGMCDDCQLQPTARVRRMSWLHKLWKLHHIGASSDWDDLNCVAASRFWAGGRNR